MRLLQSKSLDTCKRLIQEFVEKVIVTREKIEVIFNETWGRANPYAKVPS